MGTPLEQSKFLSDAWLKGLKFVKVSDLLVLVDCAG
jgi:hypothetical protein